MKESKTSYTRYQALNRNILFIIIFMSIAPMIFVSITIFYHFHSSYKEKVNAHLGELVLKHKQRIDLFLEEKLDAVTFLLHSSKPEKLLQEAALEEKLAILNGLSPAFVDLGIVNESGLQVAYAGPFRLAKVQYNDAFWLEKALANDYYVSDVFLGLRGHPHFIITTKFTWDSRSWILRATIDFNAFNTLVENLRIGETGFAFILNREGLFQTKPPVEINKEQIPNFWDRNNNRTDILNIENTQPNGDTFIYVASFLKNDDWVLVYRQTTRDAYSDLTRAQHLAIMIIIFAGIIIITLTLIFSRRIVTRIKKTDTEKEFMNLQVIESGKLASIGELAAGIAHEINNPVAIMVEEAGWIGDLLEEDELKSSSNLDEFKRSLEQIHTQGRRCKDITHKLLSFARKTDPSVDDLDVNALIEEVVALSAQMARHSHINIVTELQHDLPPISVSSSEMQQVLMNLINNALNAMEENGGTIKIISKLSKLEKGHIVIVVEDDGHGIPESVIPRIFDPFFTTKPVGKGTGLGLSICYGIINKIGGKIDVSSVVDVGTRFRVWLPYHITDHYRDTKPADQETGEADKTN
ncbi:MAG: two-component sensor histidine kinase [Desulfobacterales bacterium]|nr:two-component sensor histidine kinase [Desulfobacterales bacterium]